MKNLSHEDLAKYLYRLNGYGDLGPEILDLTHEAADRLLQMKELEEDNKDLLAEVMHLRERFC